MQYRAAGGVPRKPTPTAAICGQSLSASLNRLYCLSWSSLRYGCVGCGRFRIHFAAYTAQGLHLGEAFLFFVDAYGDEFDHRLSNAKATLQFQHNSAVGLNGEQHVVAVVEFANHVSKLAPAHLFDILYDATAIGDIGAEASDQFIHFLFDHVRPNNEHNLINTRHPISFSAGAIGVQPQSPA